jgi:HD-like signal output (HDOD) protein/CheY-like chemotaxis protein
MNASGRPRSRSRGMAAIASPLEESRMRSAARRRIVDSVSRSILFVDDDQDVLGGLRDLLRSHRREWDMVFVASGEAAVTLLGSRRFDVVISDMRMPKMDGAALLQIVKERDPRTVRVILTGQTELEVAMRTISIAHQFLAKPCDAGKIEGLIHRACELSSLLNSDELRSLAGGIGSLPSAPQTYVELDALIASPNASLDEVSCVLERDVATCAKILQLVNSAFFGIPRRISRVRDAVSLLGTTMVRNLALSMGAFATFEGGDPRVARASESLRGHSIATARIARRMFKDKQGAEDAFIAGMLHGIGYLIVMACRGVDAEVPARPGLLGAYLLGLWGIPYPVVEAVAYHEDPSVIEHTQFELADAIYLAHHLAGEQALTPDIRPDDRHEIDTDYLQRVGISSAQIAVWRALSEESVNGRTT